MHAYFKPVLIIFAAIFLFFYVFSNSKTLETTTELVTLPNGMPVQKTHYHFHCDRFADYIKDTPGRVKKFWGAAD